MLLQMFQMLFPTLVLVSLDLGVRELKNYIAEIAGETFSEKAANILKDKGLGSHFMQHPGGF